MTINRKHLEENEIMSEYSTKVKQNNVSNCVMLELDPEVLDHARKVARALNEKYEEHYGNGGANPRGYCDLFGVLRVMLDLQLESETDGDFGEDDPFLPTAFSKLTKDIVVSVNQ
jgi:hypothetical protein